MLVFELAGERFSRKDPCIPELLPENLAGPKTGEESNLEKLNGRP